ncbi:MAG: hypothetical protein C0410_08420 [Anaerolinea sp.]|nr:hypothetical protein [Anaerolinea sp.]
MKIFIVAMPDSVHTARWITQIQEQGWEIFLFPVYIARPHPDMQKITVFGSTPPRQNSKKNHVRLIWWTIPFFWADLVLSKLKGDKTHHYTIKALAAIIRWLQPDLVHSLEIQHAGYLTLDARKILKGKFPVWAVANWGSDLCLFGRLAEHRERIRQVLEQCDYYSCECERDVILAQELGLRGQVLPAFPNTGGFDLQHTETLCQPGPTSRRRTVLLKGYQHWAGRALVGLRALVGHLA